MVIQVIKQYTFPEEVCVKVEGQCNHFATECDALGRVCVGCGAETNIDDKFMEPGDFIRKEDI